MDESNTTETTVTETNAAVSGTDSAQHPEPVQTAQTPAPDTQAAAPAPDQTQNTAAAENPDQEPDADRAELDAAELRQVTHRAAEAELRAAAALSGVPAAKLAYVVRLCDASVLEAKGADMSKLAEEQVAALLRDVPELAGTAAPSVGSLGDHKRTAAADSAAQAAAEFAKYL